MTVPSASSLSCPKQARCPGCPLGDEPYAVGLARKGRELGDVFLAYSSLPAELLEPRAASPTLAYRLRAKLVSHRRALGLFERGSHRVIDVAGCKVLSPELARASDALRALLPLPIYGADLRQSSEGVLVTLLTDTNSARSGLAVAARTLVDAGHALSVAVAVRREGDVRLLAGEPELVSGPSSARHALNGDAPYAYAAHGGFVQAHAAQASYVYAEIVRGLRERLASSEPRVLELFAGNGSLALSLAKAGARVTAVESYAPAIQLAERAAREQGLKLRAVASDATRFIRDVAGEGFDAVIVNPPRRGLEPQLRAAIGRAAPRALAYVSCNPHTLARDAWHLQLLGLAVERAEPLDMIPWSDAIEALAWFRPAPPPAPRVLFESELCLAVEKQPHEVVAENASGFACLSERVRRLPGCAEAVPLESWGPDVSGVCWFAKRAESAASLRQASSTAERELLVLSRGNVRKQGTVTRRGESGAAPGARYRKQADVARHSLLCVLSRDDDERALLRDLASIRHPVLGDAQSGDTASNQFMAHRHGLDRAFVHCSRSQWRLPDGSSADACSELAPDVARVVTSLGSDQAAL